MNIYNKQSALYFSIIILATQFLFFNFKVCFGQDNQISVIKIGKKVFYLEEGMIKSASTSSLYYKLRNSVESWILSKEAVKHNIKINENEARLRAMKTYSKLGLNTPGSQDKILKTVYKIHDALKVFHSNNRKDNGIWENHLKGLVSRAEWETYKRNFSNIDKFNTWSKHLPKSKEDIFKQTIKSENKQIVFEKIKKIITKGSQTPNARYNLWLKTQINAEKITILNDTFVYFPFWLLINIEGSDKRKAIPDLSMLLFKQNLKRAIGLNIDYYIGIESIAMQKLLIGNVKGKSFGAFLAGYYRLDKCIPALLKNILLTGNSTCIKTISKYPCLWALIRIGHPALDEIIKKLGKATSTQEINLLIEAIFKIKGKRDGILLVKRYMSSAKNDNNNKIIRQFIDVRAGKGKK